MLTLMTSYPTPSQKKFQDAYENQGLKREKTTTCFKLNIKNGNVFFTYICTVTIKIFTSHKK